MDNQISSMEKTQNDLIEELNEKQLKAFHKFKSHIEKHNLHKECLREYNDRLVMRFLRARKFDPEKSLKMLADYIKWRKDSKHDELSLEHVKDVLDLTAITYIGKDKYQRPVCLVMPGTHKPGSVPYDQVEKLMVMFLDIILTELGEGVENMLIMIDYEGWGLSNIDRQLDNVFFSIGQNFYPERLFRAVLVKPPGFFGAVWTVIKTFLDERTRKKVHMIYDHGDLYSYFSQDTLLDRYGGKTKPISIREFLSTRLKPKQTLGQYLDDLFYQKYPEQISVEELELD